MDVETRVIVSNQQNRYGTFLQVGNVFVGELPSQIRAAYSFPTFYGVRWAVLPWRYVEQIIDYTESLLETMVHMSFHIHQPALFGSNPGWNTDHINNSRARVLVQLELYAHVHALKLEGEERLNAISDALSIRRERRLFFGRALGAIVALSGSFVRLDVYYGYYIATQTIWHKRRIWQGYCHRHESLRRSCIRSRHFVTVCSIAPT